ncbi:MAG: PHP domain-containing protein, partial [Chitinivibrionales bacterium]|nr:PHP domain-containing protein [Chitinivibrionales bacterium]
MSTPPMPALLSVISHYSLRRGVLSPERICERAAALGYDAVALTDRDNLYGLPEFLYQAQHHGIRTIIAAELSDPSTGETALVYSHGHEGYANLCRLISERHCVERFSLAPSIQTDPAGLHVVTDGLALIEALHRKCKLYFRIRRLHRPPGTVLETAIPLVVVPDMAFETNQDQALHRLLRAIDGNTTLSRLGASECLPSDALLRPWHDIRTRYAVFDEALKATAELGQSVRSRDQFGATIFPQADSEKDAVALLRYKVCEGAKRRYPALTDQVLDRIEHELGVIERKGFASYFLIVDDIVKQSPRTCGRGSAAASIVSYCLGITNVDPIRHNLMFERFLNPGRVDPPDIDVDFAWDERDGVLDYVFEKYGTTHAAMVATHGTFGMRWALREVARVYGLTESEISTVTKRMPQFYHFDGSADIADELATSAATRGTHLDPPWPEVITWAQKLLGMPSAIGTHCGGVIITPGPINREAPIQYSAKGYPIVQWEKDGVEEMGLVKIDLLGNRSLAVIRDAVANVRREGVALDELRWDPASDGATIDLLGRGKTMGVFYVESPAMRLLQEKSKAGDFGHMVIHSSLIRPAANRHNREYIRRLHGGAYTPVHPLLAETLAETYGIMVYQEDVTRVAMQLAGFSVVDAEGLRKIMAKKARRGKLEDYQARFVEGARRKGVSDRVIAEVWDMMMSFSGYSFCKPHSASYV